MLSPTQAILTGESALAEKLQSAQVAGQSNNTAKATNPAKAHAFWIKLFDNIRTFPFQKSIDKPGYHWSRTVLYTV